MQNYTMTEELRERVNKGLAYFWSLPVNKWGHPAVGISPLVLHQHQEYLRLIDLFVNGAPTITKSAPPLEPPKAKPEPKTSTGIDGVTIEQAKEIFGT